MAWKTRKPRSPSFASPAPKGIPSNLRVAALTSYWSACVLSRSFHPTPPGSKSVRASSSRSARCSSSVRTADALEHASAMAAFPSGPDLPSGSSSSPATLFIAAAIVCFAPMIMSGILMAHAGYSPPVARQKGIVAAHPLQVVRQRVDIPFVAVMNYREAEAITVSCFAERMENICRLSAYDSDAFSTDLYSPRSKGILSEYSDCPSQTMA